MRLLITFLVSMTILSGLFVSLQTVQAQDCGGDFEAVNGLCLPKSQIKTKFDDVTDVNSGIIKIINLLLEVAFGIAVLMLVIGGFWYLTAGGSPDGVKKGKSTIVNALIGIAIIILAYAIVNVVVKFVSQ